MPSPAATPKKKPADPAGKYRIEGGFDPADLSAALEPVAEPLPSYTQASEADLLRRAIAEDPSRHGQWLRLRRYRPMPKRLALAVATSWRRTSPARFGGDRHFEARIIPTDDTGSARPDIAVTRDTLYAVAVLYPTHPEDPVTGTPQ